MEAGALWAAGRGLWALRYASATAKSSAAGGQTLPTSFAPHPQRASGATAQTQTRDSQPPARKAKTPKSQRRCHSCPPVPPCTSAHALSRNHQPPLQTSTHTNTHAYTPVAVSVSVPARLRLPCLRLPPPLVPARLSWLVSSKTKRRRGFRPRSSRRVGRRSQAGDHQKSLPATLPPLLRTRQPSKTCCETKPDPE